MTRYRGAGGAVPGNLHLLGRLAEYKYYNMDAIVARALDLAGAADLSLRAREDRALKI